MNRRDFFKFLPVAPIALPMTAVAMAREGGEPERNLLTLQMQKDLWRVSSEDPQVHMSIGKDGELWIRKDKDSWKRVVTE